MAVRTTPDLVRGIIETDDNIGLDPFIGVASLLVDECCVTSPTTGLSLGYPDATLTEIETWLAAHFYAVRDKRTTQETVGSLQEQYETKTDLRLQNTSYGQAALVIDFKGGLAALNNGLGKVVKTFPGDTTGRRPPRVTWLGTPNSGCGW